MTAKEIVIGNICSLCAMVTDAVSGTRKKHRQILAVQIISQFFYAAGSIILKGYSSTAQNVAAVGRNLAAMFEIKNKTVRQIMEWSLIALGVALGILLNNRGLLGWLPIVANLEYSVAVFRFKDRERELKISFIVNMVMYAAFSFVIMNYVGAAANVVVAVTTAVSLIKDRKKKDPPENPPENKGETQ